VSGEARHGGVADGTGKDPLVFTPDEQAGEYVTAGASENVETITLHILGKCGISFPEGC
jgi:hypothetical protein